MSSRLHRCLAEKFQTGTPLFSGRRGMQ
uniref:Uncharacterized protein n=1 Tax=Anguilla anguilla TaxID=7936 RepID=A0A0E9U3D2_ANGAN